MKIKSGCEQDYKAWLDKNTDAYGRSCFAFAEAWASLMEAKMLVLSSTPEDVIKNYADKYAGFADDVAGGISGFMYGTAVSILAQYWEYGETLRKWHNKKYRHEGGGVVNPAILVPKTE